MVDLQNSEFDSKDHGCCSALGNCFATALYNVGSCFRRQAHNVTSTFVTLLTEEKNLGRCMRAWFVLFNLGCATAILISGHMYRQNLHTLFWLGLRPQVCLLTCMCGLGFFFLITVRIRTLMFFRFVNKAKTSNRSCCEPSPRAIRAIVVLLGGFAIAGIIMGSAILKDGLMMANAVLNNCSVEGSTSKAIEDEHKKIREFAQKCHQKADHKNSVVYLCPDYRETFPTSNPFPDYLARMELSGECTGFCDPYGSPLFSEELPKGAQATACSQVVAQQLGFASTFVGVLSISLGAVIVGFAFLLHDYEHL